MDADIIRLLKMSHYRGRALLKFISTVDFLVAIVLVFSPLYFPFLISLLLSLKDIPIDDKMKNIIVWVGRIISIPIALQSALRLWREYNISKYQIVGRDYLKEFSRQVITFLMDSYRLKGSCRVTIFIPKQNNKKEQKLYIYDRINAGEGPIDGLKKNVFFTMGQGIPGRAWQNAWSGDDVDTFIDAMQIGNVPENILNNKDDHKKYFKEEFGITDDKVYEGLGEKKFKIRSYMAVAILGRFQQLSCVLCIDSEEKDKFVDFELLKNKRKGRLTREEGMAIVGRSNGESIDSSIEKDVMQQLPKVFQDLIAPGQDDKGGGEWQKTKEMVKEITCIAMMKQSKDIMVHAPAFLFGFTWAMKQLRDIFMIEGKV